jgi:hypothetical protein
MWKRNTREHAGMRTITPLLRVLASLRIHGIENDRRMRRRSASCGGDGATEETEMDRVGLVVTSVTFARCRRSLPVEAPPRKLRGYGTIRGGDGSA